MSLSNKINRRGFLNYMLMGSATLVLPTLSFRPLARASAFGGSKKFLLIVTEPMHVAHTFAPVPARVANDLGRALFVDGRAKSIRTNAGLVLGDAFSKINRERLKTASTVGGITLSSPVEIAVAGSQSHGDDHDAFSADIAQQAVASASASGQQVVGSSNVVGAIRLGVSTDEIRSSGGVVTASANLQQGSLLSSSNPGAITLGSGSDVDVVKGAMNAGYSGVVTLTGNVDSQAHGNPERGLLLAERELASQVSELVAAAPPEFDVIVASPSRQPAITTKGVDDNVRVANAVIFPRSSGSSNFAEGTRAGNSIILAEGGKAIVMGEPSMVSASITLGEGARGRALEQKLVAGGITLASNQTQIVSDNPGQITLGAVASLAADAQNPEAENLGKIILASNDGN